MIELILLIIVAFGLYKILRGVWYFIRGVFVLMQCLYFVVFNVDKGYKNDIKKTPQYKAFCESVDRMFNI
jgi:hypothetical protein